MKLPPVQKLAKIKKIINQMNMDKHNLLNKMKIL